MFWKHGTKLIKRVFIKKSYTYSRRPVKLVYYEESDDIGYAIAREKQLKKWVRKKKIALINMQEEELKRLAKRVKKFKPKTQLSP